VAELIDRPQVEASRVEREGVPVIDARVFAEAVQEDDGGPRVLGGPVPVVGLAFGWSMNGMSRLHQLGAARARLLRYRRKGSTVVA
jgi:hypothetical protein